MKILIQAIYLNSLKSKLMKTKLQFSIWLFSSFFLMMCTGTAQQSPQAEESVSDKIEVFDFHTDHRCKTCLTIEKLTKSILQNEYSTEMEEGIITFQLINADDKENFDIAKKFGAFGTSLIINVIQNGEESFVDLTKFAFLNAANSTKFTEGFQEHIDTELKKLAQ
jgi:hypothetical protein